MISDRLPTPHRFVFPCGASYSAGSREEWSTHLSKNGRTRLVVTDSVPGVNPPLLDGKNAPCLTACPKRHARRINKAWPPDEVVEKLSSEGKSAFDPSYPWRYVVTCLGQWTEGSGLVEGRRNG